MSMPYNPEPSSPVERGQDGSDVSGATPDYVQHYRGDPPADDVQPSPLADEKEHRFAAEQPAGSVADETVSPTDPESVPSTYRPAPPVYTAPVIPDQATVVARQKQRFGGVKVGSAFFGWLTATGLAVILIALLTAAGVAFGVATNTTVDQALQQSQDATGAAKTVGLVGGILLLVILFAAYYCGGYVAGRMARFNGLRQGLTVWLWGIVIALIIAAIAAIAGSKYNIFARLDLPRLPINEGQVTAAGFIAIGAALLAALVGALLGGLAGMRFHRHVDAAGLDPVFEEPPATT